jgi:hypothetical protein
VLSPDAALVNLDRWRALDAVERRSFLPLCPDLVVELASPSDGTSRELTALRRAAAPPLHGGERPARLCADAHLAARAIAIGWRLERTGPVPGLLNWLPAG